MDDLLSEFLAETNEALDTLDSELVALEQRPDDPALLGDIFRLIHTIKGTCGFLELRRLELVAHAAEDVLGLVRDGELQVTPHAVSLILAAIDRIKLLIAHIGEHGVEPEGDDEELTGELKKVAAGKNEPVAAAAPEATPPQAAAVETGDLMARLGAASALDAACEIAWSALAFQDRPANAPELATLEMQFEFLTRLSEALAPTDPDEEGFASFHKALLDAGWRKSDIEFLHEELCKAFLALEVPDADVDQLKNYYHYSLQSLRKSPFYTEDYESLLEGSFYKRLEEIIDIMLEQAKKQMELFNDFKDLHRLYTDLIERSLEIGFSDDQNHRLNDLYELRKDNLKREKLEEINTLLERIHDINELRDHWDGIKWYLLNNRKYIGKEFETLIANKFDLAVKKIKDMSFQIHFMS